MKNNKRTDIHLSIWYFDGNSKIPKKRVLSRRRRWQRAELLGSQMTNKCPLNGVREKMSHASGDGNSTGKSLFLNRFKLKTQKNQPTRPLSSRWMHECKDISLRLHCPAGTTTLTYTTTTTATAEGHWSTYLHTHTHSSLHSHLL